MRDANTGFISSIRSFLSENWSFGTIVFSLTLIVRFFWSAVFLIFFNPTGAQLRHFRYIQLFSYCLVFLYVIFSAFLTKQRKLFVSSALFAAFFCVIICATVLNGGISSLMDEKRMLYIGEAFMVLIGFYRVSETSTQKQLFHSLDVCSFVIFFVTLVLSGLSLYLYVSGKNPSITLFGTEFVKNNLFIGGHGDDGLARYYGFYSYPTVAGFRCFLGSLCGVYLVFRGKLNWVPVGIHIVMSCFMMSIAEARTAMIMMAILLLVIAVRTIHRTAALPKRTKILLFAAAGVFLLITVMILKRDALFALAEAIRENPAEALNNLSSDRINNYRECIRMGLEKPFFGYGWLADISYLDNAHNLFMNIFAWTGFIGLFLFVSGLFASVMEMKHHSSVVRNNPYLFCLLICVFIQSMLDKAILGELHNAETYLFWIILGLFAHGCVMNRNQLKNQQDV